SKRHVRPRRCAASLCSPVDWEIPPSRTSTTSPRPASSPSPTTSSVLSSSVGAGPCGRSISGLLRSAMRFLLWWVFGSGVVMGGIEDIDHEDQGLAGELPLVAVGSRPRDPHPLLAADRNVQQLLVPAGDHLLGPLDEAEGGATFPGGVELLAVRPRPAGVVHGQVVALAGRIPGALDQEFAG